MVEDMFSELLNLPELSVTHSSYQDKRIDLYCEYRFSESICPCCKQKVNRINNWQSNREIRDLPISGRQVYLHLTVPQFACKDCGRYFYPRLRFVSRHGKKTLRYAEYLYDRCIGATVQYVASKEDVCWKTLQTFINTWSEKEIREAELFENVRALGIDEIAIKKGHKNYVCVLVNLETGQIIDILEDRTKKALISYFEAKGAAFCDGIEVYSSDMWDGYLTTGEKMFKNAEIVVDRFHFFGHMQKAVDNCRKSLRRKYPDAEELKGIKYQLLKNSDKLTDKENQELTQLFKNKNYEMLEEVYNAREEFQAILNKEIDRDEAKVQLDEWVEKVSKMSNRFINKFLKTFDRYKKYILNYFNGRWSNGIVEGINNKIKAIKRNAFGFREFKNFRTRVIVEFLGCH